MKYAIVALALLAFAPAARADAQAEAQKLNDAFIAAVNVKDTQKSVQAVLALFTEDAQHIGVFGRVHGKKEFQQILPKVFADPSRQGKLTSVEGLQLDENTILSISHFDNLVTGPDGKPMPLPLRCTRVLQKQKDGRWLISAEHTSFGPPPPPPPPAAARK
ncbi:MAG TPA: SgcJ/EcaC family oxidoreductase [Myxococcaceae bacterium]